MMTPVRDVSGGSSGAAGGRVLLAAAGQFKKESG